MRARYARGADRRPAQNDSRCGRDTRKVRRQPAAHSGFARARRRYSGWLPRHPWDRREDGRPAFEPLRSDRKLPVKRSRRTARSRIALQESRDAAHRCAALQEGRDATLAWSDADIRGLGGSDGITAATRALRPRKAAPRGLAGVTREKVTRRR